ncbi:MAG: AAA family ATPase, partial [Candidatus Omnitrophica bacterium]|nr:AAA family ATPase [Candidatus Omnitrophota bacterium]
MKNIVIVGFMGTGKTVVAKALAEKLGRGFLELDA